MSNNTNGVVFLLSKDGNRVLELDATSEMTYNRSAVTSDNTMQSGVKLSDHYHPSLPVVTFSGVITDSKINNRNPISVATYRKEIEKLMDSATQFTLFGTWDDSIPSLDNCVITQFDCTKGLSNLNSLSVTMTVKQIDFGMRPTKDTLTPSQALQGQADSKGKTKSGTSTKVDGVETTQFYAKKNKLGRFAEEDTGQ